MIIEKLMEPTNYKKTLTNGFLLSTAILLFAGIGTAQPSAHLRATKEYKRLVNLSAALRKITGNNYNKEPYRSLLKRNDKDIVYSDPSGEWYVRSRRFWDLEKKYHKLAIADKIAWTAAENPLPGECEGYVNCNLSVIRMTYGEYLKLYPRGAYLQKAMRETVAALRIIADEAPSPDKSNDYPTESADSAERAELIKELTNILASISHPDKKKALSLLKVIKESYS